MQLRAQFGVAPDRRRSDTSSEGRVIVRLHELRIERYRNMAKSAQQGEADSASLRQPVEECYTA